jgi:hypothetical protein
MLLTGARCTKPFTLTSVSLGRRPNKGLCIRSLRPRQSSVIQQPTLCIQEVSLTCKEGANAGDGGQSEENNRYSRIAMCTEIPDCALPLGHSPGACKEILE